jgi:hypothetical protein
VPFAHGVVRGRGAVVGSWERWQGLSACCCLETWVCWYATQRKGLSEDLHKQREQQEHPSGAEHARPDEGEIGGGVCWPSASLVCREGSLALADSQGQGEGPRCMRPLDDPLLPPSLGVQPGAPLEGIGGARWAKLRGGAEAGHAADATGLAAW